MCSLMLQKNWSHCTLRKAMRQHYPSKDSLHLLLLSQEAALPLAEGSPHGRIQLHNLALQLHGFEGLLPGGKEAGLNEARTHDCGGTTSAVSTVHNDVATLPPLNGKFCCHGQLLRCRRNAIPASEQKVGVWVRSYAAFGELAREVHNARPGALHFRAVAATEPPARGHLVRGGNARSLVPESVQPGIEPGGDVKAREEQVGP
mmetsp:Transcript_62989/g.136758  ORF Transcript_62989/g.136758 Transcript_62989/m.136758 type:complete len:203 (-) Transcript_62989:319-927(-)